MSIYEEIGRAIEKALSPWVGTVVVWLSLDGAEEVTLFRFDTLEGGWYWEDDWYEGQIEVELISFSVLEDVAPVIHAHWLVQKEIDGFGDCYRTAFVCSECRHITFKRWNYCPNCGARMDGKEGKE